ncbi:Gag-Pro-Pol poly [Paramuricea clavata]|uniref:Gag-Pro-Pol poly n=1 Tax=Paramuricea clavata TaxID=317549 RepID=A0A6S7GUS7_PARCT|nr:Gag-Pro-Pol poly [Paramuricea clavata]
MDTFQTAVKLIRPGCFMASIDLKDAYYSIPVADEDRKFLMFEWQGTFYQFTCLPNGLSCAPGVFTKILKPVYSHLRGLRHTCMGHIDDSLLLGYDREACKNNIEDSTNLFQQLGFVIHPEKSVLHPVQAIEFLGFVINSLSMTGRLLRNLEGSNLELVWALLHMLEFNIWECMIATCLQKKNTRQSNRSVNRTHLDNATLVHRDTELAHGQTAHSSSIKHTADTTPQWGSSPTATSATSNGLQSLWQSFQHRGISNDATAIILQSWSAGTQKQYQPYIAKWHRFCAEREINPYNPPLNIVLDFLASTGPRPKYQITWDVQPVLTYLSSLGTANNLDVKTLSLKLLMLVALVSAQRGQSLHMLDITLMKQDESSFEFLLPELVKQSRPGDTISRWIRQTMTNAGVDAQIFKPHSTRAAATSKAKEASVPIQDILNKAGWSSSQTFDKFYHKHIVSNEQTFATAVLSSK